VAVGVRRDRIISLFYLTVDKGEGQAKRRVVETAEVVV
jgi:hypothetical protein